MFVPDGLRYVQTNSCESGNLVKYSTFLLLASSTFLKKSQWENLTLIISIINRVYVLIILFWTPIIMLIILFVLRHREGCPQSLSPWPLPIFEKIFTCLVSLSSFLSFLTSFRLKRSRSHIKSVKLVQVLKCLLFAICDGLSVLRYWIGFSIWWQMNFYRQLCY